MTASGRGETSLRVLVVGDGSDSNVCSVYRTGMFVPHLAGLGVEVRFGRPAVPNGVGPELGLAIRGMRAGESDFEAELEWADVIVFRRIYQTNVSCPACDFASTDVQEALAHGSMRGHYVEVGPDVLVRPLFDRFEAAPETLHGRAVVYETDDDILHLPPDHGLLRLHGHDLDLVERMIRFADLVTTTTPVLAARLARINGRTRVVRNAVDPDWYGPPPADRPAGDPRILYYGSSGRLRDYEVCRDAVDAAARRHPGTRRVWLGAPETAEHRARLGAAVDELLPFVVGVPAFCRSLALAGPDIGVAPVVDGEFERAKSELHWLDYSMAGAATVATRTTGDGPYRAIRPGVDGLVARSKSEWREAIESLARSRTLRQEMAGRARERVLAEYTVGLRAREWADAFRWAAEHAGLGRTAATPALAPADRPAGSAPGRESRSAAPAGAARGARGADVLAAYVAAQRFAAMRPIRLAIGPARPAPAGWVTMDAEEGADIVLDAAFGVPFADASVDSIYATNNLEDLGGPTSAVFGREAARALRPGGVLRLVTRDRVGWLELRNRLASQGVVFRGGRAVMPLLDEPSLVALLQIAGFAEIRRVSADESASPALCGLESVARLPLDAPLIVEAVR